MDKNQELTPFEWLGLVINSMEGIKKTNASMEDIRQALIDEKISEKKIDRIISFLEVPVIDGKNSAFTSELGIKPPATHDWRGRGQIPARRVEKIVEIGNSNGVSVKKHHLRPDKWNEDDEPIKAGSSRKNAQMAKKAS